MSSVKQPHGRQFDPAIRARWELQTCLAFILKLLQICLFMQGLAGLFAAHLPKAAPRQQNTPQYKLWARLGESNSGDKDSPFV